MGRAAKFSHKIYCGNCGKHIQTIHLETKPGAHTNKLEIVSNHESCSSAGTNQRTYGYSDIHQKKRQQKPREYTVNTSFAQPLEVKLPENAP